MKIGMIDVPPPSRVTQALRYMPDVVATASEVQLRTSKDFVVYVCAVLGEMDAKTTENRFLANPADSDPTTNSMLRMVSNGNADQKTWDAMDEATFNVLENVLSPGGASKVRTKLTRRGEAEQSEGRCVFGNPGKEVCFVRAQRMR